MRKPHNRTQDQAFEVVGTEDVLARKVNGEVQEVEGEGWRGKGLSARCRPWHFGLSRGGGQGNGGGGVQLSLFEIRFDISTSKTKKIIHPREQHLDVK